MKVSGKKLGKLCFDKKIMKKELTKSVLLQGLCFALCFFAFQLTEFTVNDRTETIFGSYYVITVYSVGILCTALGFLSFALIRKLFRSENARKASVLVVGAIAVLSAVAVITTTDNVLFFIGSAVALFSLGNIGGCVYYNAAMTFQGNRYAGRIIGVGMGVAVLLQFIVQNYFASVGIIAYIVSVAASVAILVFFVIRPPRDWMFDNPLPYSSDNKTDRKVAVTLIVAVTISSVVCALLDGVVVPAHAAKQTSVSNYVRLFYAASLIAAGFVADIKERKYLSIVTVCLTFLSTVSGVFYMKSETLWLGTALVYIFSGFYVMFLTIRFLDFAPKTKNPALWAGMGRSVRGITVAVSAIPTSLLCSRFGNVVAVVVSCVLSIIILLVLLRDVSLIFTPKIVESVGRETDSATLSQEEKIKTYAVSVGLTPRETDVLVRLLSSEDGVQEIADSLYISRRVLQRYIASIYEKTETKSRVGLYRSLDDFFAK